MPRFLRPFFYAMFPLVICLLMLPFKYYPLDVLHAFKAIGWLDEAAHAVVFFGLGFGMVLYGMSSRRVFFALALFAGITELLQALSGRTASFSDLAWDIGGIGLAYLAGLIIQKNNKNVD